MIWKKIKVEDFGKVITGNTPPKKNPEFYGGAYKFIKPTDMEVGMRFTPKTEEYYSSEAYEKYIRSLIPPLSTCVVTIGSIGKKITLTDDYCFVNQAVNAVVPEKEKYDPYFVFYSLKNMLHRVKAADTGASSGRENVSKSNFSNLTLEVPCDISHQHKISSILCSLDNLIENNLKRINLFEEAAKNIYREWFINLRFFGHEKVKFHNDLPIGWEISELGEILEKLESGSRPKGGIDKELREGIPSIGAENVTGLGKYDVDKEKLITLDFFEKMNKGHLEDKDILIYKDGAYIGKTTLFQDDFPSSKCAVNEHVFLIHAKKKVYQYYLFFTLNTKEYFSKMQLLNSNSAQPGINQPKLKSLLLKIPDEKTAIAFDKLVSPLLKQVFILAKQNQILKEARDILLPRLMNRTIEV